MDATDLRTLWAEESRRLDHALSRTEPLVRELAARRVRSSLQPALAVRSLECVSALLAVAAIAPVALAHRDEARYLLAAAPTLIWLLGFAAHALRQIVLGVRLDAGAPVAETQRAVLSLRRAEFASLRWAVLGGVFAWLPLAVLLAESATGEPVLPRLPAPWLWANMAVGAAAWAANPIFGRHLERRAQEGGAAARLLDALTSRGIRRAEQQLRELAEFGRDA